MINKIIHRIKFSFLRRINTDLYNKAVEKQLEIEHQKKDSKRLRDLKLFEDSLSIYNEPIIKVINMNANDVCNSKCVMCRIWNQEKKYEVTPEDVLTILKDPLYKNIEHIGVTGGEPTLREDLPKLYEAIFKALPNIKGVSSITNCINHKDVIDRYEKVIEVCKKYNKNFSMMISLDGVGQVHERVRRVKGNFESAMIVYNHFKNKGIEIATGTTISRINVWDIDETLDFLIENNMYGRFRIAELINRLYNDDAKGIIRNFTEDETYNLVLFFHKLILRFEQTDSFKRTYKSIINMLLGGDRLIGCPYRYNGLVLNSRGEIAYCAPKSKIIGNALNNSSLRIYKDNLSEKERIFEENCANCIHDYHSALTYKEELISQEKNKWERVFTLKGTQIQHDFSKISPLTIKEKQAFITGWYGTETVGDKAILGQIINDLRQLEGDDLHIIISAIYPFIVERTCKELRLENVSVVDVYSKDFVAAAKGSSTTIMGGGPLMDLDALALPLIAFQTAKENNKKTIIYGCGLGPLIKDDSIVAVKKILELADDIKLRDTESAKLANDWLKNKKQIEIYGDPAKKYLAKYKNLNPESPKDKTIRCFLRDWTYEYGKGKYSYEEFVKEKELFEQGIANLIISKAKEINAQTVIFEHMHNFVVGNDDRDFSRYFIKKYLSNVDFEVTYNKHLSTVDSIATAMKSSSLNICMRFHSVLFAHTLETNFLAIDYTLGGKILSYLRDNNALTNLITKDQLIHID